MGKDRKTVSLDNDIARRIDNQQHLNFSALVNDMMREYFTAGRGSSPALQARLNRIEQEISEKEDELERLRMERDEIQTLIEEDKNESDPEVEKAIELLSGLEPSQLTIDNPAVQNWASKTKLTPSELLDIVAENTASDMAGNSSPQFSALADGGEDDDD